MSKTALEFYRELVERLEQEEPKPSLDIPPTLVYISYLSDPKYWVSPCGEKIRRYPRLEACRLTRRCAPVARHCNRHYQGQYVLFTSSVFTLGGDQ